MICVMSKATEMIRFSFTAQLSFDWKKENSMIWQKMLNELEKFDIFLICGMNAITNNGNDIIFLCTISR